MPCCVVLYLLLSYIPGVTRSVTLGTKQQEKYSQLSSTPLAQQRRVVPCGIVRCRALRCGVVPCCALFHTYSRGRYNAKYQVPSSGMYVWTGDPHSKCLSLLSSLTVLFTFFFLLQKYTRTADQNVTSPASTQHSTAKGNQLCTSSSWPYQVASYTKSWASSAAPFVVFFVARG